MENQFTYRSDLARKQIAAVDQIILTHKFDDPNLERLRKKAAQHWEETSSMADNFIDCLFGIYPYAFLSFFYIFFFSCLSVSRYSFLLLYFILLFFFLLFPSFISSSLFIFTFSFFFFFFFFFLSFFLFFFFFFF